MMGVSGAGLIKEEEIELDLGLSIGGSSFRKPEKSKESKTASSSEPESGLLFDPQTKREIQAMRRQEAKRKREEKRSRGRSEPQAEEPQQQPAAKRDRVETANVNANVNLNLSNNNNNNARTEPRFSPVPPGQQYSYPPVQFVPCTNGFAYPCVVPCWAPAGGGGGGGCFRPFKPHIQDSGNNSNKNGCETKQNGGGLAKTVSFKESPMSCSSTVSSHQSAGSSEGGGSSESRIHSSNNNGSIMPKETKNSISSQDHKATSNPIDSNSQSNGQQLAPPKSENTKEPGLVIPKPISPPNEDSPPPPPPPPLKGITKMDPPIVAKPPKPQTQVSGGLPQMPYVSTTGNGPNGRTIHGFLYRYTTKSEISIVCVCHGSTFSPAKFVEHAGGTDVSQPLRHITVIPSAF